MEYRAGLEGRSTGMKYKDEVQEGVEGWITRVRVEVWSTRMKYRDGVLGWSSRLEFKTGVEGWSTELD